MQVMQVEEVMQESIDIFFGERKGVIGTSNSTDIHGYVFRYQQKSLCLPIDIKLLFLYVILSSLHIAHLPTRTSKIRTNIIIDINID